jgi:hypothetical protein
MCANANANAIGSVATRVRRVPRGARQRAVDTRPAACTHTFIYRVFVFLLLG